MLVALLGAPATYASASDNDRTPARLVIDANGTALGAYGGIATVRAANGARVTAILTITDTDFIVPLTTQGKVGLFNSAFFTAADCKGREYLPIYGRGSSMVPVSGLVYRSLISNKLRYIERYTPAEATEAASRQYFDPANKRTCENISRTARLLPTRSNDPEITGFAPTSGNNTLAISAPLGTNKPRSLFDAGATNTDQPLPADQQECSPGCTVGDVGNNACDIACYVNACSFDSGDCDQETPEFLQQELAKYCSPGCSFDDLGDGFCDTSCNNNACEFDRGDCEGTPQ